MTDQIEEIIVTELHETLDRESLIRRRNAERNRAYYQRNKHKWVERAKKLNSQQKERMRELAKIRSKLPGHKEAESERKRKSRVSLKEEVFSHYSGGKICCVACGFSDIRALSIDHINGDGARHRRENQICGGWRTYKWLKDNGLPDGFQVLCMNCQYIKRSENDESTSSLWRSEGPCRPRRKNSIRPLDAKVRPENRFQGVSAARGKLMVRIGHMGKTYYLGSFDLDQEELAAKNYDYHAINVYGRGNTFLNFPEFDYSNFVPRKRLEVT